MEAKRQYTKHDMPEYTPENIKIADDHGISKHTYYTRLLRGWEPRQAMTVNTLPKRTQ